MIKILLVDDDVFYRTTFINLLDWASFGCEITHQADNGQQAIQILEQHTIDVVITDINMPILNGVDLVHYTGLHCPWIKCLVLSGFDDFIYVKQSMKYGAVDYILKHTLTKELMISIIQNLMIPSPGTLTYEPNTISPQKQIVNNILFDVVSGNIRLPEHQTMEDLLSEYHMAMPNAPYAALVIRLENRLLLQSRYESSERYQQFFNMAVSIIQNSLENYGDILLISNNVDFIYAIISNESFKSTFFFLNTMNSVNKQVGNSLHRFLNIDVSIGHSNLCINRADLIKSIQNALIHLNSQTGQDILLESENAPSIITISLDTEQKIIENLLYNDFAEVENTITNEFRQHKIMHNEKQSLQHLSIELISIINKICRTKSIPTEDVYGECSSPYATILKIHSYRDLVEYTLQLYHIVYGIIHSTPTADNVIVQNAIHYINLHYAENISLSTASKYINCNAAYLSRIFKNEIGINFVQYLTNYRIRKAKILLDTTNDTIRDIAAKVGFENYNYFFTVFKKNIGITPQEYLKHK